MRKVNTNFKIFFLAGIVSLILFLGDIYFIKSASRPVLPFLVEELGSFWVYVTMLFYAPVMVFLGMGEYDSFLFRLYLFLFYFILFESFYLIKKKYGKKGLAIVFIPILLRWFVAGAFFIYVIINWYG